MTARSRAGAIKARVVAASELRDGAEVLLFARVMTFAAVVPLLMRFPLPRVAGWLDRPPPPRRPSDREIERLARVVRLGPRVAAPIVRPGCLTRGVTLFWFLRRSGLGVELRFGVDPGAEADGHCWLTLEGEPFLEERDPRPRFTEVYRLGHA